MKYALTISSLLLVSNIAFASGGSHWGYSGHQGPDNWASLSADYSACSGKNQSPINLTGFIESEMQPIKFNYKTGGKEILNNGHTVQVNYKKGSSISIDGMEFNLLQFHFHAPSENHINGKSYPLEAHFVHADKNGHLAVVAVMFEQGSSNAELAKAWSKMPKHEGDKSSFSGLISAANLLPGNHDYYRFNGSLTTPPCSEGVRWFVMKDSVKASKAQIDSFKGALHSANNRPLQALNARMILK